MNQEEKKVLSVFWTGFLGVFITVIGSLVNALNSAYFCPALNQSLLIFKQKLEKIVQLQTIADKAVQDLRVISPGSNGIVFWAVG